MLEESDGVGSGLYPIIEKTMSFSNAQYDEFRSELLATPGSDSVFTSSLPATSSFDYSNVNSVDNNSFDSVSIIPISF